MSRCFPYPPPGYVKNGIRDEALIKSVKGDKDFDTELPAFLV
ncbi:hypothetical protein Pint_28499 [Pistacia integerrima]|uniref:Uncharacterized protein n=1 Tax=Pistacia integerrima TaxID=434235 RepID=A0ACC0YSI8_9ROSI|nr:hypothetical protein Pint_28499 [Pistacia integerrima]